MADLNYYRKLLNVTPNTSRSELKKAYRLQAKQWHPDRFPQEPEKRKIAEVRFKEITVAYEYLCATQPKEQETDSPENQDNNAASPRRGPVKGKTMVTTERTDPKFYYLLGVELAEVGKLEESLDLFTKAIKFGPSYLDALEYRQAILSKLGFEYRAAADLRRIKEIRSQMDV